MPDAVLRLRRHQADLQGTSIMDLFQADTSRFPAYTISAAGITLDYSKNLITDAVLADLIELAREKALTAQRDAMFNGERINTSEDRAVLHTALRALKGASITVDGVDIMPAIHQVLEKMRDMTARIHSGAWVGYTGRPLSDIVNIGIGGEDLGPRMACTALRAFHTGRVNVHFVSNVDGHDLEAVLSRVSAETTLFIVSSRSFTTAETMMNARSVRSWLLSHEGVQEEDLSRHFAAVTANPSEARAFGIAHENIYPMWDWVGGCCCVWSAIGLPVMLAVGYRHFMAFLFGAHAMDLHFRHAPLEQNMPVLLAMTGIWNRNLLGYHTQAVAPYHEDLSVFSRWLQQLEMESNGKSIQKDGTPVTYGTAPIILGDTGANGQHSYFQLFHQGTDICPVDFIAVLKASHPYKHHHALLLANCFAQAEALMKGSAPVKVRESQARQGLKEGQVQSLVRQKTLEGRRPSNMILMEHLGPETLGALMALYEHKVFVQGVIWNIDSFGQWCAGPGDHLAAGIAKELAEGITLPHDSSTAGLAGLAKAAADRWHEDGGKK